MTQPDPALAALPETWEESIDAFLDRTGADEQDWRAAAPVLACRAFHEDIPGESVAVLAHLLRFPPGDSFSDKTLAETFECDVPTIQRALAPLYAYAFCARIVPPGKLPMTVLEWTVAPKRAGVDEEESE